MIEPLTQVEMGLKMGVSYRTIQAIEHGVSRPSITTRRKFNELRASYRSGGK